MLKNVVIVILFGMVIILCYFIISGRFCTCSEITCPADGIELKPSLAYNL